MNLFQLCDRCKKNMAVVFYYTQTEGNTTKNGGLCISCARALKIPIPTADILEKLGISEEDFESMTEEMTNILQLPPEMGGFEDGAPPGNFNPLGVSPDEFMNILKDSGDIFPNLSDMPDLQKLLFSKEDGVSNSNNNNNNNNNTDKSGNSNKPNAQSRSKIKEEKNKKPNPKRKNLEAFCMDLTQRAREGKIDNIIGRERELDRIIQILCRRQKNNPCLIGEPGVGKTAIAEALAVKIASGKAPVKLEKKEVHLLDLTGIVAGTQFRGQFESRMKGLIEEIKRLGNIILVIDEAHTIIGAGDAEGSMNAGNILKPALSRGDIQVIGATTLGEYRRFIEKDSALERRFQPIVVKEPSIDESVDMILQTKKYYEDFHAVKISENAVRQAVILSERYITDRFLPDKAIDLLDESAAYVAVNSDIIEKTERLKELIDEINSEIEIIESGENMPAEPEAAAEMYQRHADLKQKSLKLPHELDLLLKERAKIEISAEDLAQVIEKWTGVPASSITENEFTRLNGLESRLKSRLVGQEEAVGAVVRAVKRSRVGIAYKRKPVSFIFAGATGVGKTELVRTLAMDLFNSPESLIRLDMSEFMEKHAVSRIIGAPPGYIGYDEAGQLTEKIRRKPYSVILFDEIEKAHPDVMNILLQILDDGKITDAHGREVNFENTIIVMTTNAGSNLSMASLGFSESEGKAADNKTQKALSDFLRPEFLNRVDEIITFRSLTEEDFAEISKIMLGDLKKALDEKSIEFAYTEEAAKVIAKKSYSKKYGARNLRRLIQTEVEDKMANLIIENREKKSLTFTLDASGGENGDSELTVELG
ncbi:MAG: ATP-dependent Clp protease ATP-binding subunit [Oscillospiraceae bacterium]|nr:ATP-dependent Clp protease ATP-binding subunit [Oscillospiraceae bacterium]